MTIFARRAVCRHGDDPSQCLACQQLAKLPDCDWFTEVLRPGTEVAARSVRYCCSLKRGHPEPHDPALSTRPWPGYYWVKPKTYPTDPRWLTVARVDEKGYVQFTGIDARPPLDDILLQCTFVDFITYPQPFNAPQRRFEDNPHVHDRREDGGRTTDRPASGAGTAEPEPPA